MYIAHPRTQSARTMFKFSESRTKKQVNSLFSEAYPILPLIGAPVINMGVLGK